MTYINNYDSSGNPAGGTVTDLGISIRWQDGPVKDNLPNGAQIVDVLKAAEQRLVFFQNSQFACLENERALVYIRQAIGHQNARTRDRTKRGVEGTHQL